MSNRNDSTAPKDEQVMQALAESDLEAANGGFSLSGAWDDVKSAASDVATEVENHPIASLAMAAAAVTGVGAVADALAIGGTAEAAAMGVTTGDMLTGAAVKAGAAGFSGMAMGGVGTAIAGAIKKA